MVKMWASSYISTSRFKIKYLGGGASSSESDDNVITETGRWRIFCSLLFLFKWKDCWGGIPEYSFVVTRRLNKPTNDGGINNWLHVGFWIWKERKLNLVLFV
jgi:hypothetical protein